MERTDNLPSILSQIARHAQNQPNKTALTFLSSSAKILSQFSYAKLIEKVDSLSFNLQHSLSNDILVNKRPVILIYTPSLEFIVAFLACLKLEIIAVPVYPPINLIAHLDKLTSIVSTCGSTVALCNSEFKQWLRFKVSKSEKSHSVLSDLEYIVTDTLGVIKSNKSLNINGLGFDGHRNNNHYEKVAFLQFTSGSTADPKGVSITHGNLAHNLNIIVKELNADNETVVVSWLPQYHDMGLIGSYLGLLYCGGSGFYMSPVSFLQRPMLWLELVSKYRATHLQAPNFAYKLCARKFVASKCPTDFDLTSIRHMINGAEPIDTSALDLFMNKFEPYGIKQVIYPTYGLAEHTVFVCSGGQQIIEVNKEKFESDNIIELVENNNSDVSSRKFVGCGYPSNQHVDVRIVDPETCAVLEDRCVGEVWVNSPSKAMGYYNLSELTERDFHARVIETEKSSFLYKNDFLRTGDLGFFHEDELFICGRIKDVLIVGGRNIYPQDIEKTVEGMDDNIRPGCLAAFATLNDGLGEEKVVLTMELRESPLQRDAKKYGEDLARKIHSLVLHEHGMSLSNILLLKPRTIPKTTSGKIARSWCKKAYLRKSLAVIFQKSFDSAVDNNHSLEPSELTKANGTAENASMSALVLEEFTTEQVRSMQRSEILEKLTHLICQLSTNRVDQIDEAAKQAPIGTIMDSMSLAQLKGILEQHYHVREISDQYMFLDSTCINSLVESVKIGYCPDDTEENREANMAQVEQNAVARALGCPPGVCECSIS